MNTDEKIGRGIENKVDLRVCITSILKKAKKYITTKVAKNCQSNLFHLTTLFKASFSHHDYFL